LTGYVVTPEVNRGTLAFRGWIADLERVLLHALILNLLVGQVLASIRFS